MTSSYKIDEKVLKNIIKQTIKCTNENESIKLNIYYKNRKLSNLVMKNSPNTTKLQRTNILYKYECNTIIEILQNDQRKIKLIRKYENTQKKIINNECAILFNKTCIYIFVYI